MAAHQSYSQKVSKADAKALEHVPPAFKALIKKEIITRELIADGITALAGVDSVPGLKSSNSYNQIYEKLQHGPRSALASYGTWYPFAANEEYNGYHSGLLSSGSTILEGAGTQSYIMATLCLMKAQFAPVDFGKTGALAFAELCAKKSCDVFFDRNFNHIDLGAERSWGLLVPKVFQDLVSWGDMLN